MRSLSARLMVMVAVVGLLSLIGAGSAAAKYTTTQSPYSLPTPDQYNTAPNCPVSAVNTICTWSTEPPWDSANPEGTEPYYGPSAYYTNCAYWAAEKRPDIEELAVQAYGYPENPGGAADWYQDAVQAGYPVDHTPSVGSIAVWVPPYGSHVAYVQQVNSDGSIVVTEMDLRTQQYPNGVGATEYFPADQVSQLWFIHLKPTKPMSPKVAIARKGDKVTITVRIAAGSGTVTGTAASKKTKHTLHLRSEGASKLVASVKLSAGRWTVRLQYQPDEGFTAPAGYSRTVKIPAKR